MYAFDVATIRELEAETMAVVGDDLLMQRAAAGLATVIAQEALRVKDRVYGTKIMILVGPGNNGGDALFAGARLARRGAAVTAVRCLGQPHPRGLSALLAAGGRLVDIADLDLVDDVRSRAQRPLDTDLAVDGVLGIGGRPGLPRDLELLARALDHWWTPTIAVDLPSGVDADTGAVAGASFRATRTVTFGALRPCHLLEPARSRCGDIEVVDIGLGDVFPVADRQGLWLDQLTEDGLAQGWPYPDATSDKYSRGVVGADTGSDAYPGAGIMSTYGAVYAGAGMVRFLGAAKPAEIIRAQLPNVVFGAGRVQAHLFGSGWGDRADGARVLADALEGGLPAVVDADGLRYLPPRLPDTWLLTPHAGELAKLLDHDRGWVTENPIRAVRAAAEHTGATVLLKGATQLVARPGVSSILVAVPGPAWTGQAGSGDVLGGICATLLAAGRSAARAAVLGASLQAVTARRHPGSVPPHRLAELIPDTLAELQQRAGTIRGEIERTGW